MEALITKNLLRALILMTSLMSLITPQSNFLNLHNERNLQNYVQYSPNGIYYTLKYPKNDITGSGDKLADVPYKVLCVLKACSTCCVGEINNMKCGTAEECKTYLDETRVGSKVAAIIVPIGVTIIFIIAFIIFYKKYKLSLGFSLLLAFICMFVITTPFVIWYMKSKDSCCKNRDSKENHKEDDKNLLKAKEAEIKSEPEKIILCDNKKSSDGDRSTGNYVNKDYNKLNSEEDFNNRNKVATANSNREENGLKRSGVQEIIFDENLRDDKNNNNNNNNNNSNRSISSRKGNSFTKKSSNNYNDEMLENNNTNKSNREEDNGELVEKSRHSQQSSNRKSERYQNNNSNYNIQDDNIYQNNDRSRNSNKLSDKQDSLQNKSIKSANKSQNRTQTKIDGEKLDADERNDGNYYNENNKSVKNEENVNNYEKGDYIENNNIDQDIKPQERSGVDILTNEINERKERDNSVKLDNQENANDGASILN